MPDPKDVPAPVRDLARTLGEPAAMRRGSVNERYVKCNKPGCPCADRDDARHGPYVSVVRVVKGRTQSRHVPVEQVETLRRQVDAGQQFRVHVEQYWQACEAWADAELDLSEATSKEVAKKGASKRPSTRKSSQRLKR